MPIHCTCEGKCATSSCPCYKNNKRCTEFCHSKHPHSCNIIEYKKDRITKRKNKKNSRTRKHKQK